MNLTEMEAKVREATNNEPWGAPSTLMSQISAGTYNYREREEIIGFIFRRFTEKAANEWRQIYKALQLLDYLIKNGSERIIDDVRANVTLIQMLKSFHYIDSKGRDQGINVRNRAKNLITFLNDDGQIRTERKKARANAKKFGGVSLAAFGGASSISTNGGGYDDGDFTNRVYGDGGVYGERFDDPAAAYSNGNTGQSTGGEYEEYEASPAASKPTTSSSKVNANTSKAVPQEPDLLADLMDFGSSTSGAATTAAASSSSAGAAAPADDSDDDFDDFQAAPSQPQKPSINTFSQPPQQQNQYTPQHQTYSTGPAAPKPNNDAFSSLFSSAKTKTKTSTPTAKAATPSTAPAASDDFFGDFNSNSTSTTSKPAQSSTNNGNSGEVDLLSF